MIGYENFLNEGDHDGAADFLWHRCATDIELFSITYFPHYCEDPFNQFHRDVFQAYHYRERAVRRVDAAPRGSAKSTIKALIKPIHDVCYGLEQFIIICSATQPLAIRKLKDIRTEVLVNNELNVDFGVHFTSARPGTENFEVHSQAGTTYFMAAARKTELRGVRFRERRPTKIILDDMEDSNEVYNPEIRQKDEDRFKEVISKVGDGRTNIEFIGTILHRESLLKKTLVNPAYTGKIYKSIISWSENEKLWQKWREIYCNLDNDSRVTEAEAFFRKNEKPMLAGTKVLWPEREPYLFLMKEMVEIGKRAFMKEKQNQPLGSEDKLFGQLQWYREIDGGIQIENSGVKYRWDQLKHHANGVIDPATGRKQKKKLGDYSCILTGYEDPKGRVLVHYDWTKRASPAKYIAEIFELHELYNYNKFGVETNLYRELLMPNLVDERKRREKAKAKTMERGDAKIHIPFYDIENTENKEKRISMIEPKVTHGYMIFNRALSQTFLGQIEDYPHVDHDDCPDALEMLWKLVNNAYKPSPLSVAALDGR